MWLCQFNCSLKLIPRKLNSSTLSIYVLSIFIFSGFIILFLLTVLKTICVAVWDYQSHHNFFQLSFYGGNGKSYYSPFKNSLNY